MIPIWDAPTSDRIAIAIGDSETVTRAGSSDLITMKLKVVLGSARARSLAHIARTRGSSAMRIRASRSHLCR
jgi:hypothetical protein